MGARSQCVNQDDVLRNALEQQFGPGHGQSCAELAESSQAMCDDMSIAQICCKQCEKEEEKRRATWSNVGNSQAISRQRLQNAPRIRFRDGGSMPSIALGCAYTQGKSLVRAVDHALRSGYRALDTAVMYGTQDLVGEGMRASGVARENIFLISKVPDELHGFEGALEAVQRMLSELQTPYIDLCLIHWPIVGIPGPDTDAFKVVERAATWRGLEAAQRKGQCKHIGVSNYMRQHLEELLDYARVRPAVNQIEFHPYQVDSDTLAACRKYGIAVMAYGTLSTGGILKDPVVRDVAAEVGRSPGQVLLKWSVQEGTSVIPRSANPSRIIDNAQLWDFTLSASQRQRIRSLHKGVRSYADPFQGPVGVFAKRRKWHK